MPLAHQLGVPWGDTKRPPEAETVSLLRNQAVNIFGWRKKIKIFPYSFQGPEEMLVDEHLDVSNFHTFTFFIIIEC